MREMCKFSEELRRVATTAVAGSAMKGGGGDISCITCVCVRAWILASYVACG